MAGYIMTISVNDETSNIKDEVVEQTIQNLVKEGIYSTRFKKLNQHTNNAFEGTLGDYITMKEGDNIYFFCKRKIYGIGKLINVGPDCKYKNYRGACSISEHGTSLKPNQVLYKYGEQDHYRFICTFEPSPIIFQKGIDMDEALSYRPTAYRMLRAMWKLSFIKIDDEENQALRDNLLRKNVATLGKGSKHEYTPIQKEILEKVNHSDEFIITDDDLLSQFENNIPSHEMMLEDLLLNYLSKDTNCISKMDFLTHQYIASPFKPVDYMDKMDIFGYKYINNYHGTVEKYFIFELKKGKVKKEDVYQLMKYVDWVAKEFAYGDYSMINAYIVGNGFSYDDDEVKDSIERTYPISIRPASFGIWKSVEKIDYVEFINEKIKKSSTTND